MIIIFTSISVATLDYQSIPTQNSALHTDYGYYTANSSFYIVNFAHNAYGKPYENAKYSINIGGVTYSAVSNSAGFANITISMSIASGVESIQELHSIGASTFPYTIPLNSPTGLYLAGDNSYNVSYVVTAVYNPENPRQNNILLYYLGPNGRPSPAINIYWSVGTTAFSFASSYPSAVPGNVDNITFIKTTGGFRNTVIGTTIPYESGVYYKGRSFYITIYNGNDTEKIGNYSVDLINEIPVTLAVSSLFGLLGITLQIFLPLMALVASYGVYANDRISGIIDSILTRPVTKFQVMFTRYFAGMVILGVSVALAIESASIISFLLAGFYLPMNIVTLLIWGFFVETSAFIGVAFIISQIVKKSSLFLGATVSIYIGFDVFWTFFGSVIGTGNLLNFLSPGGYFNLVNFYVATRLFPSAEVVLLGSYNWSAYLDLLFIAGLAWIIVPFAVSSVICKIKD